jgi:hypothetical protein
MRNRESNLPSTSGCTVDEDVRMFPLEPDEWLLHDGHRSNRHRQSQRRAEGFVNAGFSSHDRIRTGRI